MLDLNDIDDLLSIWRTANNVDAEDRVDAIVSADAVAFKPLVTICEDGSVEDIADFDCLESPTCSHNLLRTQPCFTSSFSVIGKKYTPHFLFFIEPVHGQLTCCAIHTLQAKNGKGTP
jgi:hypothetical protein